MATQRPGAQRAVTTELGRTLGLHLPKEQERLYRATLRAIVDGLILGSGRHGVVVALTNEPTDARFKLAVKLIHKVFVSSRGRGGSFHRAVSHVLHLQNEVAAMAKLSATPAFVIPLYCAFQDDDYVYLVMERACCSLKQLIQHSDDAELSQLLAFQQARGYLNAMGFTRDPPPRRHLRTCRRPSAGARAEVPRLLPAHLRRPPPRVLDAAERPPRPPRHTPRPGALLLFYSYRVYYYHACTYLFTLRSSSRAMVVRASLISGSAPC